MKKPLWAVLELPLKVTKEVLWSVLTEPQYTEKYMYNCKLKCNWEIGDQVQWVEVHQDESETIHVSGELLEFTPYRCLRYTIFHKGTGLKGQSSELRFMISPHREGVLLTIEQGDFSSFHQAEVIHAECQRGWEFIQKDLIATCLEAA
jgi:uncharacterized protein YndB with AHSA1/START domain